MASAKSSNPGKKGKNAKGARSESKSSSKLKETKKQTTKVKSRRNKEKEKQNQSNKRIKIPNGVAVVPVSSSAESGEESTSEIEELAVDNQIIASKGRITKTKAKSSKGKKKNNEEEEEGEEERGTITFPMHRIRTIVKGQDSELRLSNEAVFAINKATEKFVDLFTQDAHASCVEDRKKSLAYKYLASVVSKQRKYDFLSDFIPQQVISEDALRDINSAEQTPM